MIQPLDASQFDQIKGIFPKRYPNLSLVDAMLERKLPGEMWVDDVKKPKSCLLTTYAPYGFLAGQVTEKVFDEYYQILQKKPQVKLVVSPEMESEFKKNNKFKITPRYQLDQPNLAKIKAINIEIPKPYKLQQINTPDLFEKCLWKNLMISLYKNTENYLANTYNFCLLDGEEVICEVHGMLNSRVMEPAIMTAEKYRGQGLAASICSHLIKHCADQGIQTIWSCDVANTGSIKTAEKIGLQKSLEYTFFTLGY